MSSVSDAFLDAVSAELAKHCVSAVNSSGLGCIGCALSEYCGGEDTAESWRATIEDYLEGYSENEEDDNG